MSCLAFLSLILYAEIRKGNLAASSMMKIHESSIPPLPEGVVAVEYIESTGTQYIDTRIVPTSKCAAQWDIQVVNYNDGSMGVYQSAVMFYINLYANKLYPRYSKFAPYTGALNPNDGWSAKGENIVTYANGEITINGVVAYSGINVDALDYMTKSIILFAYMRSNQVTGFTKARLYKFKIWDSDTDLIDLLPVRIGSGEEAVGAMYDLVSNQLFYNAGSGKFLIGPDKR